MGSHCGAESNAGVYLRAAREAGWAVDIDDNYIDGDSFVRDLPDYGG